MGTNFEATTLPGIKWLCNQMEWHALLSGSEPHARILVITPSVIGVDRLVDQLSEYAADRAFEIPKYNRPAGLLRWHHGSVAYIRTVDELSSYGLEGSSYSAVWIAGCDTYNEGFSEGVLDFLLRSHGTKDIGWDNLVVTD